LEIIRWRTCHRDDQLVGRQSWDIRADWPQGFGCASACSEARSATKYIGVEINYSHIQRFGANKQSLTAADWRRKGHALVANEQPGADQVTNLRLTFRIGGTRERSYYVTGLFHENGLH